MALVEMEVHVFQMMNLHRLLTNLPEFVPRDMSENAVKQSKMEFFSSSNRVLYQHNQSLYILFVS